MSTASHQTRKISSLEIAAYALGGTASGGDELREARQRPCLRGHRVGIRCTVNQKTQNDDYAAASALNDKGPTRHRKHHPKCSARTNQPQQDIKTTVIGRLSGRPINGVA